MYIVGFNGPPRVGKDTIAKAVANKIESISLLPLKTSALSMPMRLRAFAALGIPYSYEVYELIKDDPQDVLNGRSIRDFMILDSEKFMKPCFGSDIWSRLHAGAIPSIPGITIVPDFGFAHEPLYLEERFGRDNVLTVQVHNVEDDWKNDSRGWVSGNHLASVNNGRVGMQYVFAIANELVAKMRDTLNWKL